jgi:hypothetical protein
MVIVTNAVILDTDEQSLKRKGLTADVAVWEDGLRTGGAPGTFEWWYFDGHFGDGSTVIITFNTKPMHALAGPLAPKVDLWLTRPDGRQTHSVIEYHAGTFSAATDRCDVRIGPNRASGDLANYTVHAEGDGVAVDLTLARVVSSWRPGTGKIYYDEERTHYFAWLPSVPYGVVQATLTYDGSSHQVDGAGYHDHNWGNVSLPDVVHHWYWGRAHVGNYSVIFAEITATDAYGYARVPLFMFARDKTLLTTDGAPLTLTTDLHGAPDAEHYPGWIDVNWQDSRGSVHLALRHPSVIESVNLLASLPTWERIPVSLFLHPGYRRFTAAIGVTGAIAGAQVNENGQALYEIMAFH